MRYDNFNCNYKIAYIDDVITLRTAISPSTYAQYLSRTWRTVAEKKYSKSEEVRSVYWYIGQSTKPKLATDIHQF